MKTQDMLYINGISKAFGPTKALVDVHMHVAPGEVHGLIGENGSGKSTLASIIAGVLNPDDGTMVFKGKPYAPASAIEASGTGVCMIIQEQGTFNRMSVAANVFIGREKRFRQNGILNLHKLHEETKKALSDIGVDHIDPKAMVDDLSFEDRKLIEIARAISNTPAILIIDETTTALTRFGRNILYSFMKKMREEDKTILFISHDIDEIMEQCDSLTVLRDGQYIDTLRKTDFQQDKIKQLMVGREISKEFYRSDIVSSMQPSVALSVEHVNTDLLHDISFTLHKGEILGIGGLSECGMHDLGKVLFGLEKPASGHIYNEDGAEITDASDALRKKIGYISKNRDTESLMVAASIRDNICLPSLGKLKKNGIITPKREKELTNHWAGQLNIKMNSINQYCMYLSGGNKQKVVISKWLGNESDVLILDCPTRGIDVGVKAAIYRLMERLKADGKAIIMISEELPELIGMSDRVLIMKDGKVVSEHQRNADLNEMQLIEYMI